jgi:hypothetical protein
MYEMSQRHPVWVAENHVKACNSVRERWEVYSPSLEDHWCQMTEFRAAGPKNGPVKFLAA